MLSATREAEAAERFFRKPLAACHTAASVEQDHRFVKHRVNPGGGFGAFHTTQRAIQGYEAMHMLHKGQIEGLAKRGVLAQNRIINQLFALVT